MIYNDFLISVYKVLVNKTPKKLFQSNKLEWETKKKNHKMGNIVLKY